MKSFYMKLFLILLVGLGMTASSAAFLSVLAQENITITTYYPSPAGVFNELLANQVAIGDVNGDGQINNLDLAHTIDANGNVVPTNGTLTVATAIGIGTTNPQGELHINSTDNTTGDANIILEGENPVTHVPTGSWDISALGSAAGTNAGDLQFISTTPAGTTTTPFTVNQGAPDNSLYIADNGYIGLGTDNPQGPLDINNITGGLIPPRMTTAERDNIANPQVGMIIFNTDTGMLEVYNGSDWVAVGAQTTWTSVSPTPLQAAGTPTGKLPYTAGTRVYDLPVPDGAREALIFISFEKGGEESLSLPTVLGADVLCTYTLSTRDGTRNYTQFFTMHNWEGYSWVTNSDNLWFPVTPNKKLYVTLDHPIGVPNGHKDSKIELIGYR